ncbi:UTRA domain-containing protein [Streptomyces sp. H10-C2]|uniref:UTRA domain-containing protein n=1 Tax=unclassified Streptomyces TaxID=2593676 RepID=UPI0022AEB128|nr:MULTISPECIES: UTRA domain-containing protein [unclassified Streptomyces]MCZ4102668.1 UTRA domain-containing protein [Streptomyces sp. H39-C1]MDJ0346361.1 UTRA domain-containing protein [Streptomyces sp. PH10-H1]MDJ0374949.1 UTRA domain-containing protein [Streptomyces sp. H10-C2]
MTPIAPIRRNAVLRYSTAARERAGGRGAFDTEIKAMGLTPRTATTIESGETPAKAAELLGTQETIARVRRMYADDIPVQLATSYIPAEIATGTALAEVDSGQGGIISRFTELGHAQVRITERLTVRTPSAEETQVLDLSEDHRVYEVLHTGWTAENRAVEVCFHVMPVHLWELDYEWAVDAT